MRRGARRYGPAWARPCFSCLSYSTAGPDSHPTLPFAYLSGFHPTLRRHAMTLDRVSLTRRGTTYTLETQDELGILSVIRFPANHLLMLLPLIQKECAQIEEILSTQALKESGIQPTFAIPVHQYSVMSDVHQTNITLSFRDP